MELIFFPGVGKLQHCSRSLRLLPVMADVRRVLTSQDRQGIWHRKDVSGALSSAVRSHEMRAIRFEAATASPTLRTDLDYRRETSGYEEDVRSEKPDARLLSVTHIHSVRTMKQPGNTSFKNTRRTLWLSAFQKCLVMSLHPF